MPYTVDMVKPTGAWTKQRIGKVRLQLGESVEQFGARFGRSGRTVEDWEQGRRNPDPLVIQALERLEKRLK